MFLRQCRASALVAFGLALPAFASMAADAFPEKSVRVVVGFSAGGPTDVIARAFAEQAGRDLSQPFVVENRPGANTILAADAVARAPADGYTILFGATNHTMIPALYSDRVKFDAAASFAPICVVAASATVLVTRPTLPVRSLADFLALVKEKPGVMTYATPGTGSSGHFASERFLRMVHATMNPIPYKGAAQAVTDVMGGQVDASFATLGSVLPHIQSGKLIALAVAAPARSPLLPDVPTFEEAGVKGYVDGAWYGLLAPAGTPAAALDVLRRAAVQFAKSPETRQRLDALGMETQDICGDAFGEKLRREIAEYKAMARELKLDVN